VLPPPENAWPAVLPRRSNDRTAPSGRWINQGFPRKCQWDCANGAPRSPTGGAAKAIHFNAIWQTGFPRGELPPSCRTIDRVESNLLVSGRMSDRRAHDLLHGVSLEQIVTSLVEHLGWNELGERIKIRCFTTNPSIKSSLKFLRKTSWARTKVEELYIATQKKRSRRK
jgi:hypothetical protein